MITALLTVVIILLSVFISCSSTSKSVVFRTTLFSTVEWQEKESFKSTESKIDVTSPPVQIVLN